MEVALSTALVRRCLAGTRGAAEVELALGWPQVRLVSATATSSQSGGSIVPSLGMNLPFPASGAAGLGGGRSGALGPRRGGSAAPTLGATVLGSGDDDVEWHGTGKVAKSDAYSQLSASIAIVTTLSSCFLPPTLDLQVADDDRDATESMETTTSAGVRM
uniref:Uncharacterized protein n=2 Tax=Oryza TaxID=4527 RepID=A0A0D3HKY7_9ORYZ